VFLGGFSAPIRETIGALVLPSHYICDHDLSQLLRNRHLVHQLIGLAGAEEGLSA
jgi:hypothetical protein